MRTPAVDDPAPTALPPASQLLQPSLSPPLGGPLGSRTPVLDAAGLAGQGSGPAAGPAGAAPVPACPTGPVAPLPTLQAGPTSASGPAAGDTVPLGSVALPQAAQAGTQSRTEDGIGIVGDGVSPSALAAAAAFVDAEIGDRTDIQGRMTAAKVQVVIVPRDKRMTDLPQFAHLRNTCTVDGRRWEEVRGSGGVTTPDGHFAVAVPEENLVNTGTGNDPYGAFNVGLHEFAHVLHSKGLSQSDQAKITALYAQQTNDHGEFTETYGRSNEKEYFAQATNAFFRQNGLVGKNSPEWLQANDPDMYAFLVTVYGQPPAAATGAAPGAPAAPAPAPAAPPVPAPQASTTPSHP